MHNGNHYKMPRVEKPLNKLLEYIFYLRLPIVILAICFMFYLGRRVWLHSLPEDKMKNMAIVFTGCSVMIGIFYSIINYEHNMHKFNHDVQAQKELLTFNTASFTYKTETVVQLRKLREFYEKNKDLIENARMSELNALLDDETRVAMVVIMNYFESIAIGIEQGIMDEPFMKGFLKTIFVDMYNRYNGYIIFLQTSNNSGRIFWKYLALSKRWQSEV